MEPPQLGLVPSNPAQDRRRARGATKKRASGLWAECRVGTGLDFERAPELGELLWLQAKFTSSFSSDATESTGRRPRGTPAGRTAPITRARLSDTSAKSARAPGHRVRPQKDLCLL